MAIIYLYWFTGLEAALRPVRMEREAIFPSKFLPSSFQGIGLVLVKVYIYSTFDPVEIAVSREGE